MEVKILYVILLLSSSLLFSTVICGPNHHHNNHNDFPWQNILSSLGIVVENQTGVISNTQLTGDPSVNSKEHYTSETPVEILKSETKEGIETPVVGQNGITIDNDQVITGDIRHEGLGTGFKIGIPIVSILFVILFWYCVCKCCCACCQSERPGVVVMQSNQQPAPAAPQIILQQPIIHQQAPPMYETQQKWAHPPPQGNPQWSQPSQQGHSQWNQPPQGPPQWTPHPMGEQQQYSPHGGYDNAGFNPATAPPPYNTGKY